jgi:hypothetical protein
MCMLRSIFLSLCFGDKDKTFWNEAGEIVSKIIASYYWNTLVCKVPRAYL